MQDDPPDEPDNSPQPQHQSPEITPISGDAHVPPTPVARINMERSYMGPIASPQMMREFEAVIPGSARELLDDFLADRRHVREMEKDDQDTARLAVTGNLRIAEHGQIFALVIALVFGILAFIAIIAGHDQAGAALGGATLASIVATFVIGRWRTGEGSKIELDPQQATDQIEPPANDTPRPPG